MNIKTLDFFKIPEGVRIPYFGGKIYKYLSKKENEYIKKLPLSELSLYKGDEREEKIIVSLTTFPARINTVFYSIKSLMHQTVSPDRIILWLAETQFSFDSLPEQIKELCELGLEIRFVEDLKSHKKYHYALKEQQKNELVITYDDDIIYPEDSIERLYKTHLKYRDCIVCNRAAVAAAANGKLQSYSLWKIHSDIGVNTPSTMLFPSTGGGTLYPFGSVNEEAFNVDNMKETSFSADDLWMRFMSALNGTKIIKTRKNHRTFTVCDGSQTESLQVVNCLENGNNEAIEKLSARYPEALEKIVYGNSKG